MIKVKKMEETLPVNRIMRVHCPFIANLEKVSTIERNSIVFDRDTYIPVSEQYKAKFREFLNENFLV